MDTDSKILGLMGGAVLVCVWIYQNYYVLLAVLVFFFLMFSLVVGVGGPPVLIWWREKQRREQEERRRQEHLAYLRHKKEEWDKGALDRSIKALRAKVVEQKKQEAEQKEARREYILKEPLYALDGSSGLERSDSEHLWSNGYKQLKFVPLGKQKPEWFLIKTQPPESPEHTFVVQSMVKLLQGRVQDINTYATVNADIIVWHKDKEYAFEIETPLGLRQKKSRLREKARTNDELYPHRWWFVVTRSAYKRSFTRYGKVLTRNEVIPFINKKFPLPRASSRSLHNIEQRDKQSEVCNSRRQKQKRTR